MPAVEQTFWLLLQETMTSSLTPALLTVCVALVTRFLTAAMVRSGPKPMVIGFWRHMGCYLGDGLSLKRVATSKSRPYIRVIWPLRVICGYRGHLKTTKCVSSNNNTRCTNKKGALYVVQSTVAKHGCTDAAALVQTSPDNIVSTETSKQKLEPSI